MVSYFRIGDDERRTLETRLAGAIPQHLLERGWDFFRREKVLSVQAVDGSSIYGTVRNPEIVAVTIDTEEFEFSACTCQYKGYCEHMAAVYYAYCEYIGESAEEVHNRLLYGEGLITLEKASAESKAPGNGEDPAQWLAVMEQQYGESWKQCRHSLHPLQTVLTSLKSSSRDWEPVLKQLHWMHSVLFVVEQAERAYSATDSYNRYYYEMAFARMTEPWIAHYREMAAELDTTLMRNQELEAVNSLITFFHERDMEREQQLHRWEMLYFALWKQLVTNQALRSQEEQWLEKQLKNCVANGRQAFFYPLALSFLAFVDHQDEHAVELLQASDFQRTGLLACDFAQQRFESKEWESLTIWMAFLYEALSRERKSRSFGPFLELCRRAAEKQPDNPRWEQYMVSFLPSSFVALSDHWLGSQRYDKWADLQLLFGIDPGELDVQHARELSKVAPHVLMPIYHQAIDNAIRSRNRQGYKTAVKLMKKLERLYKSEKLNDRWKRYVDGIVNKHQRLRALQEELWRGKIIT